MSSQTSPPGAIGPGVPRHPQATTVLVLGIVSAVCCTLVGFAAWIIGNRVVKEIDASGGRLQGRAEANIGRIIGMITGSFSLLVLAGVVFAVLLGLLAS